MPPFPALVARIAVITNKPQEGNRMAENEGVTESPEVAPEPEAPEATEPSSHEAELPQWAKDQLAKARKEAANYRTKVRELEPLAKEGVALKESQKTEAQKVAERATEAESRAAKAEQELARYRVANAKKVPPEWVDRLRGDSEEELAADADKILAAIKAMQPTGPKPDQSQGARATGAANADMNTLLRAAAGRG